MIRPELVGTGERSRETQKLKLQTDLASVGEPDLKDTESTNTHSHSHALPYVCEETLFTKPYIML